MPACRCALSGSGRIAGWCRRPRGLTAIAGCTTRRVARLELVTTLRELGVSLANVRRVLGGQVTAAEVAAIHLEALDTEIRTLRLRRAVVAAVVKRSADGEEMGMINKLARLSAAERRQIVDDFTAEVFCGLDPSPARFARWAAAPDLPDDLRPSRSRPGSISLSW